MLEENLIAIYEKSFRDNYDLPALSDYTEGNVVTYGELARQIARIHIFFHLAGIKKGDKVALLGKSNVNWVMLFIGTITYGAVIVPILPEFNPQDAQHIINHSDSKLLFVSDKVWDSFDFDQLKNVLGVISADTLKLLMEAKNSKVRKSMTDLEEVYKRAYPGGFTPRCIKYPRVPNSEVIEINYTSGTTGFSKGVMLTLNNLTGNVVFGIHSGLHYRGSRALSFLPLAHAYGCAFDMLTPLATGSHITLLGKMPTPKILVKAMGEVRPNLICSVPLVLEKIYRKMILPQLEKRSVKMALAVPGLREVVYGKIRQKLIDAFGGCFTEVIIGGAALNGEVEEFLMKIKFPFTVGYGMTECGPLISYTYWTDFIPRSSGRVLPKIMHARIDSPDQQNIPGEICVKGENVMSGYYKNKEASDKVLDKDGWFHTGDVGVMSKDGTIFIRGRYKTMILTSSGQNIYPEEIESKLNVNPYVSESLVVERSGKLVALIYPDAETMDSVGLNHKDWPAKMEEVRKEVNSTLAGYEQIAQVQLVADEFEKTPKRSIKRYLYDH